MIKLKNILKENFGGPGEAVYPPDHKAGMRVTKGGSMCQNCSYWIQKGNKCENTHWIKWHGDDAIPHPADEYCCDWWEPSNG